MTSFLWERKLHHLYKNEIVIFHKRDWFTWHWRRIPFAVSAEPVLKPWRSSWKYTLGALYAFSRHIQGCFSDENFPMIVVSLLENVSLWPRRLPNYRDILPSSHERFTKNVSTVTGRLTFDVKIFLEAYDTIYFQQLGLHFCVKIGGCILCI